MLGAPPGFIPTTDGDIVNVHSIDSVCKIDPKYWFDHLKHLEHINFNKPVICVESRGVKWFFNMSVQQFAARMIEAMKELSQPL